MLTFVITLARVSVAKWRQDFLAFRKNNANLDKHLVAKMRHEFNPLIFNHKFLHEIHCVSISRTFVMSRPTRLAV